MKITIITVSLNNEKTIGRTIDSVLEQTANNLEYILKDGGSTDNTLKIAESYRAAFEKRNIAYKIIQKPDHGLYEAMNQALEYVSGNAVGFLNSDDWYSPTCVQKVTAYFENNETDAVSGAVSVWDETGTKKIRVKVSRLRKFLTSRDFCHPALFVREEIYQKYPYDENLFYADYDLWIRLRKDHKKILIVDEPLSNFRLGGVSNRGSLKEITYRYKERKKVYQKNHLSKWYIFECFLTEYGKWLYYKGVRKNGPA